MRFLKGHIDLLGLGNLIQLLALNKFEGMLAVTRGNEKQTIHLAPGGIRLLSSTVPRVRRIGRLARAVLGARPLAPHRLLSLLKKEKLLGWTLGHLVLSTQTLREEDIREALRQQVEEEVLDMFVWDEASFEFVEGRVPHAKRREPLAGLTLHANVTSLLLEAARRADEVHRILQSMTDDRLQLKKVAREIHADALGEDVVRVDAILPLINGRRSLRSILQASIYPRFATLRALHKLLSLEYVQARAREPRALSLAAPSQPL